MDKIHTFLKDKINFRLLSFFIPLLIGTLYVLRDGKTVFDIWLPGGSWNDECSYFKQIEAAIKYDYPQGYWGYNESKAQISSFGAWGVTPLIPYIILGKIFSWGTLSPVLCNIFFMMIAFLIFAYVVRATKSQLVYMLLILLFNPLVTRYMLSGMTEALSCALLIMVTGFLLRLYGMVNKPDDSALYVPGHFGERGTFAALLVSILILSLIKPYFFAFLIFPFIYCIRGRYVKSLLITLASSACAFILWYLHNMYFCAAYFFKSVNFDFILSLLEYVKSLNFYQFCIALYDKALEEIAWLSQTVQLSDGSAFSIVLWLAMFLIITIMLVFAIAGKKKEKAIFYAGLWLINFAIFQAVYILYLPIQMYRHVMALTFSNALIIFFCESNRLKIITLAICFALALNHSNDAYQYNISYASDYERERFNETKEELASVMELSDSVSFDNAVFYPYTETKYNIFYALPAGFSIQYSNKTLTNEVKCGYAWVGRGLESEEVILKNSLGRLIYEDENGRMYELRER